MTEEVASAGRVDAEVQQGSGGGRFHVHVGGAELLLLGGQVPQRQLGGELRPRRRSGDRDLPGEAAFRDTRPPRELRGTRDRQARDVQIERNGAIEQRRDRGPVTPAHQHLHQLSSGERRGHLGLRHDVALRLRAEFGLHLVLDGEGPLEREAVQAPDGDLVACRVHVERRIPRCSPQTRRQAHGAGTARRQEAGPGKSFKRKLRHGEICLDRTIQHAAQIRPIAERARQIEGNLRGERESRLAAQLDGAIERCRALLDEETGPRVHLLDRLRPQVVRLEGHSGPRGRQGPSGDDARVDHAAGALLLQRGQLRRLGQPREIELREPRLELDGRIGRLRGDGLDR